MRTPIRNVQASGLLIASAALFLTGCPAQPDSTGPSSPPAAETPAELANSESSPTVAARPQIAEPPPKPSMPKVVMTEAQAATCLKQVGDQLPDATVKTLDGQEQALTSALGKTLSVVLFWSNDDPDFATFLLEDMTADVVKPHGDRGVQLVAINVRGDEADIRNVIDRAKAEFPVLRDENGALFEQLATEKLPRIYLVDGQGKILWFDIEYSRTTRRQLDQAIQVALGEQLAATSFEQKETTVTKKGL